MNLSFETLRKVNLERLPHFKNSKGEAAHSDPYGRDWKPAQWLQAVVGELGEYANIRKKYERGDIDFTEFTIAAQRELADVVTYLDILAFQLGIDLGEATIRKFNEVSIRVGSPVRINASERTYTVQDMKDIAEHFAKHYFDFGEPEFDHYMKQKYNQ